MLAPHPLPPAYADLLASLTADDNDDDDDALTHADARVLIGRVYNADTGVGSATPLGYAAFRHTEPGALVRLVVAPPYRRQAFAGARMLAAYERHVAREYGVRRVRVDAPPAAAAWFTRHGYWRPPDDATAHAGDRVFVARRSPQCRAFDYTRSATTTTHTLFRDITPPPSPPQRASVAELFEVARRLDRCGDQQASSHRPV